MSNELTLTTPIEELEDQILEETDIDELHTIIDLFNLNIQKKNIIRNSKLNEIQDKVVEQMYDRVTENAYEFSNQDLIQLHKTLQDTISKTDSTLDNVKVPSIQVNQQINLNQPMFDRDSKRRIIDAVQSILEKSALEEIDLVDEKVDD